VELPESILSGAQVKAVHARNDQKMGEGRKKRPIDSQLHLCTFRQGTFAATLTLNIFVPCRRPQDVFCSGTFPCNIRP
jgi:hypothetical protein